MWQEASGGTRGNMTSDGQKLDTSKSAAGRQSDSLILFGPLF
jgi:hypothetical protein